MEEAIKGTTEAISLIDDPILRILISLLFLIIVVSNYFSYKIIKSLMLKNDTKDKEVVEAYNLIYKDSKANLELVYAFENKLDSHLIRDEDIKQDVRKLLSIAETMNYRLEELTKK